MISPDRLIISVSKKFSGRDINTYEHPIVIEKQGSAAELVIFLPHRNASRKFIEKTIKQFKDQHVITFVDGDPMVTDPEKTIDYYNETVSYMMSQIDKLAETLKPTSVTIIGVSLGCMFATYIAERIQIPIKQMVLVVGGASLARSLWEGSQTQDLKEMYVKQNFDINSLDKLWKSLSPEAHLNFSSVESVSIYLSKADKAVPYSEGVRLAELIKKKFPEKTNIHENTYKGHALTILWASKNINDRLLKD